MRYLANGIFFSEPAVRAQKMSLLIWGTPSFLVAQPEGTRPGLPYVSSVLVVPALQPKVWWPCYWCGFVCLVGNCHVFDVLP